MKSRLILVSLMVLFSLPSAGWAASPQAPSAQQQYENGISSQRQLQQRMQQNQQAQQQQLKQQLQQRNSQLQQQRQQQLQQQQQRAQQAVPPVQSPSAP